jgi:hypothetical protein
MLASRMSFFAEGSATSWNEPILPRSGLWWAACGVSTATSRGRRSPSVISRCSTLLSSAFIVSSLTDSISICGPSGPRHATFEPS